MNFYNGENLLKSITPRHLSDSIGTEITFHAYVYQIRKGTGFSFIFLRCASFIFQSVYIPQLCKTSISELCEGAYVKVSGKVKEEKRASFGFEITLTDFEIISKPEEDFPLSISDNALHCSVETNLKNRSITLRRPDQRAVLKIADGIVRAFSDFMYENDFTRIFPPSICDISTVPKQKNFKIKYFDRDAFLTPNKQTYMQAGVAFFDRVFSVSDVFQAEKHNSTRHLNEFTSLDFELGFINNIYDIINIVVALLNSTITKLKTDYSYELELCKCQLPNANKILTLTFSEALNVINVNENKTDLDPTDCRYISEYAKKHGSDFVFITHFPAEKCPVNYKESNQKKLAESFILLYNGLDIADGGQKINSYYEQSKKIEDYELPIAEYNEYLTLHKYALPPHGGCSIMLERFIMKLLNLENVKLASLFARDMHHLSL